MIALIIKLIHRFFLRKKGVDISIASSSRLVLNVLTILYKDTSLSIRTLKIKFLSFNPWSHTAKFNGIANGIILYQKKRRKATAEIIDFELLIYSRNNARIISRLPGIATITVSIDNDELYSKCLVNTDDLNNILPDYIIFRNYIKSLVSKELITLSYFKNNQSVFPMINYHVGGLNEFNCWQPDASALKKLIFEELKIKGHLDQCYVSNREIPELIKSVTTMSEDPAFMLHFGVCRYMIAQSIQAMFNRQIPKGGASTITQQLIKNTFFSSETSIERKFKEVVTSFVTERIFHLSKSDILELYLNMAEFGIGIYGIKSAAVHYFAKNLDELSPVEILVLTYILPRPKFFEDALVKNSPNLRKKLKNHIDAKLKILKQRKIIDSIPQFKDIIFASPLPILHLNQ